MQKITPCLWFNNQAETAVDFYTAAFANSKIGAVARYGKASSQVSGQPEGSVMTLVFQLEGQEFMALNGGPLFKFTPAISFMVNCQTTLEIDTLWNKLSSGGSVLMPLESAPWLESLGITKFGWLTDQFGLSWQLSLVAEDVPQKISPFLMFTGERAGQAEAAIQRYTRLFENSKTLCLEHYNAERIQATGGHEKEGTVWQGVFSLDGYTMRAIDSSHIHEFGFTPAISFVVNCNDQAEVDHFWESLAEGGGPEECGWLHDQFGLSWQVVPTVLEELMDAAKPEQTERVMQALMEMKKLDIAQLKEAGKPVHI